MNKLLKRWRADVIIAAVLCIIAGIAVMIWPAAVTLVLGRVVGVVLILMGLKHGISYLQDRGTARLGLASGVVIFALGILVMIRPSVVAQMVAVVVGVVLIMHGLEDMQMGMESKSCKDENWWLCMLFAAITIMFGIFVIWKYFQVAEVAAWLLGLALVFDGVSDLFVIYKVISAIKRMKEEAEAIDVEGKE